MDLACSTRLPTHAFGAFVSASSALPSSLATLFVQAVPLRDNQIDARTRTVQDVLWKLKTYLPSAQTGGVSLRHLRLKNFQALVPDQSTAEIESSQFSCPDCQKELHKCIPRYRSKIANNLQKNRCLGSSSIEHSHGLFPLASCVKMPAFARMYAQTTRLSADDDKRRLRAPMAEAIMVNAQKWSGSLP